MHDASRILMDKRANESPILCRPLCVWEDWEAKISAAVFITRENPALADDD